MNDRTVFSTDYKCERLFKNLNLEFESTAGQYANNDNLKCQIQICYVDDCTVCYHTLYVTTMFSKHFQWVIIHTKFIHILYIFLNLNLA